ncbi:MAG: AsmA family protein, partial [Burkholderiaceae bacterium]
VSVPSLPTNDIVLPRVSLTEGQANLVRDKDGRVNWQLRTKDETPSKRSVTVQALALNDASLSYSDAIQDIEVEATGVSRVEGPYATRITFNGTWRKNPFGGTADIGNVLALRETSEPFPMRLALRAGNTTVNAEGEVADIRSLRNVNAQVAVAGPSLSTLYPTLPVVLPETPPYRINGRLTRDGNTYSYNNFSGTIGSTDLAGDARFELREPRPLLTMTLKSRSLALADLGLLVGLERRQRAGAAATEKPAAKLPTGKVFPQQDFDVKRLNAMDADVRLSAATLKIPDQVPLEDFTTHLKLSEGVLVLDPLNFGFAGGDLVSTITLDARSNPIAAKASIDLRRVRLGELFPTVDNVKNTSTGALGAQIRLTGRGNSVADMLATADGSINFGMAGGRVSELGVWLVNLHGGELIPLLFGGDRPTQIRCGAAAFDVEDGLATMQLFVFDTDESRINGSGTINLGPERFDITLDPRPKKAGILSLRGPVRIYGTFRDADFQVTGQTIGRGIGAVALGLVNPLLALIPLIETGPGQSANCQEVLSNVSGAVRQSGKKVTDAPAREEPAPIVNVPTKRDGPPAPIVNVPPKK